MTLMLTLVTTMEQVVYGQMHFMDTLMQCVGLCLLELTLTYNGMTVLLLSAWLVRKVILTV